MNDYDWWTTSCITEGLSSETNQVLLWISDLDVSHWFNVPKDMPPAALELETLFIVEIPLKCARTRSVDNIEWKWDKFRVIPNLSEDEIWEALAELNNPKQG